MPAAHSILLTRPHMQQSWTRRQFKSHRGDRLAAIDHPLRRGQSNAGARHINTVSSRPPSPLSQLSTTSRDPTVADLSGPNIGVEL